MKRRTIRWMMLLVLGIGLAGLIGQVAAQRPDGDGRPTRPAGLPTRDGSLALTLTAFATPPAPEREGTLSALLTATPPSAGTLSALLTRTPRGTLTVPASSEEAAAAMSDFASLYLGFAPAYRFAGSQNAGSGTDLSDTAKAALSAILAQLPSEVQAYLNAFTQSSGLVYAGLYADGGSLLGVANCSDLPDCTVTAETLQGVLTSSAAGVYALYATVGVGSASEALDLLLRLYPRLQEVGLVSIPSESGYGFQATVVDASAANQTLQASVRVYQAGVIPSGSLSLTYAVVGVGEGYSQIPR